MKPNPQNTTLILIAFVALLLSSCTSQKELTYLQDLPQSGATNFFPLERPGYEIQKQDILYVKFYTQNQEINDMINLESSNSSSQMYRDESSLYLYGFNVTDSGTVIIPYIGEVMVEGRTLDEAQRVIGKKAEEYLKDATVIVKLLSFKFTVLGEVNRPGAYRNFNNQLTVLEAISMAGDITDYGNREQVLVLRPQENGTKTYTINLKKKDLLSSEAFFLLPNDIVIVEPISSKVFQLNIPTMSLVITTLFSTVSTTLLLINFLNN